MENEKVANLVISVYFPTFPKIIEIVRSFYHQTFTRAFFFQTWKIFPIILPRITNYQTFTVQLAVLKSDHSNIISPHSDCSN